LPAVLAMLSLLAAPPTGSAVEPARQTDDRVAAAVRATLDSLTATDAFSGAVLLIHGGHTLVREARGWADRERHVKNGPGTRFNLGSINKKFTEVAIRQLAASGKLGLDDTIARYLPDYPADKGRRITIRQLLDHRAGTGDVFNEHFAAMDISRLRSITDW